MSVSNRLARTPPMGWNSWDCFGTSVTEAEVRTNADFMAAHLLKFGWQFVVVDIQWYEPDAQAGGYRPFAPLVMDDYGRLLPAVNRFPSAAHAQGFKPLADYVHRLGLRFGLHIMRGIPRQAVKRNLPILNSPYRAADIANADSPCPWNTDMFGLDMDKPGAQEYIDSIIALYSDWGVDYIKADNMLDPYHAREIEGYSEAIRNYGPDIILSLSPGVDLDIRHAFHLKKHCELWRISADFWDRWQDLKDQFDLCARWAPQIGPGHWPDADMLPLGHIGIRAERGSDRASLLTADEQRTLMTLWSVFRSPLMFGGDLPTSSSETIDLLTNPEVLAVNQTSSGNREYSRHADLIVWTADAEEKGDRFIACFNIGDSPSTLEIHLGPEGPAPSGQIRDLWARSDLGSFQDVFSVSLQPHASALYRVSPR